MRRDEQGIALLSVLWGIAILSLIAATMLASNLSSERIERNSAVFAKANALADAGVQRGLLTLLDQRPERAPRTDGTQWYFILDGAHITVALQDQSGLIDLNNAPDDLLISLFQFGGATPDQAKAIAATITAMRLQNGTSITFHGTDELLRVPRITADIYRRVAPSITVYSHAAAVDMQVAPRSVLIVMPNMGTTDVDEFLAKREEDYRTGNIALPSTGVNRTFGIAVYVREGSVRVLRHVVVAFTGDKDKPYWFVSWK